MAVDERQIISKFITCLANIQLENFYYLYNTVHTYKRKCLCLRFSLKDYRQLEMSNKCLLLFWVEKISKICSLKAGFTVNGEHSHLI